MESGVFPANSRVFQIMILERDEIQRLKWIESEKAGRDIGWDHAFFIWNTGHRNDWFNFIKKNKD